MTLEQRLRSANPVPNPTDPPSGAWSADVALLEIERRSDSVETIERTTTEPTGPRRNRGWLLAAAVAALVVLIGAIVIGLRGDSGTDVVEPTPTTLSAPTTTAAPPTTVAPTVSDEVAATPLPLSRLRIDTDRLRRTAPGSSDAVLRFFFDGVLARFEGNRTQVRTLSNPELGLMSDDLPFSREESTPACTVGTALAAVPDGVGVVTVATGDLVVDGAPTEVHVVIVSTNDLPGEPTVVALDTTTCGVIASYRRDNDGSVVVTG